MVHIVKHHRRLADDQRGRARRIGHFLRRIQQREHRRHVDQPLADVAIDHAQHIERTEQLGQVGLDEDQLPGAVFALCPAPRGIGQSARHQQVDHQRLDDVEHPQRVFASHRGHGIGPRGLGIARFLARFGAEVFHRFVIQQAVHRAGQRLPVQPVHLFAQLGPPFGDGPRRPDIGDDGQPGRGDQPPAEVELEDYRHHHQLQHRRRDVEQHEIEHGVDRLGPALDRLGHFAGSAGEVKAQRKPVKLGKDVFGQRAGGILPHPLEHDVAQVVERGPGKAPGRIGQHHQHDKAQYARAGHVHRVDCPFQGIGQGQLHRGRNQDEHAGDHDPDLQRAVVPRPQIGQKAVQGVPAIVAGTALRGLGRVRGGFGWHERPM